MNEEVKYGHWHDIHRSDPCKYIVRGYNTVATYSLGLELVIVSSLIENNALA